MTDIPTQAPSELKPCPFCGTQPLEDRIEPHEHSPALMGLIPIPFSYPGSWSIECVPCGCRIFSHDSREEAVAKWNRRTQAPTDSAVPPGPAQGEPAGVSEEVWQVPLWDAINAYAITCGGDPSKRVYGNTSRMKAVAVVDSVVRQQLAEMRGAISQPSRGKCETQDVSKLLYDLDDSVAYFEKEALYETENMGAGGSQIALGRWRRFIAAIWEARCFVAEHGPNWRSLKPDYAQPEPSPALREAAKAGAQMLHGMASMHSSIKYGRDEEGDKFHAQAALLDAFAEGK